MKNTDQQRVFSQSFTRRDFLSTSLKAGAAAFTTGLLPKLSVEAGGQYNVLFIIADDLRPLIRCYGHPEIHTPNIDSIADRGTLFNRAYCQYPLCSPSRTSMMTGMRVETTQIRNNRTDLRETLPNAVTLPQHYKANGYHTQSLGRVFTLPQLQDDIYSWSVPSWRPLWIPYDKTTNPSWQALDVKDDELEDGKIAKQAVEVLQQIKNQQFFLTLGFYQPHLPHKVPKKYFELYDEQTFNLPVSSTPPKDVPSRAINNWNSIREYQDLPSGKEPLSDAKTLELIRAYAAATSYMDAQIGRVLSQLDLLGLTENTVIAFCGDHGYHLGDHGMWGKQTLFEVSLRSPMIISVPGQQSNRTEALSELVDIYPTLCDACQLPIPSELEGLSLMPVIEQPTHPWKTATFSQFGGTVYGGVSIRTERYRYTERGENAKYGRELYDYEADPNETVNIVDLPENAELVAHLSERLHTGWQGALPDIQNQVRVPQTLPWDVNNDGMVSIQDLILVSNNFDVASPENPKVDVNKDGRVDIIDLLLVAAHFGESVNRAAPPVSTHLHAEHIALVNEWLTQARFADDGSNVFRQGIATLEHLIDTIIPTETALLPNYPNPFNPETWIPYNLAEGADVHIDIYNFKGESIRRLSLGFQAAGTYQTRARAAYWDGRNAIGEPVASGIYFYTFQAGQFKTTRKMVITK